MNQGEASVRWARLEGAGAGRFEAALSPDERARAAKFRFDADRDRFVIARGLLRQILGERLGVSPERVELAYSEEGKPRLAQRGAALRFSLSHSRDAVVMAFCEGREVGVDVEQIRARRFSAEIARRYLPPADADEILRRTGEDQLREFFRAWVRMEAYVKARGRGLGLIGESPDPALWSVFDLSFLDGYAAALAVEGGTPVRLHTSEISLGAE